MVHDLTNVRDYWASESESPMASCQGEQVATLWAPLTTRLARWRGKLVRSRKEKSYSKSMVFGAAGRVDGATAIGNDLSQVATE